MYSTCPKLASSPTNTKKKERTRNVSWLWVGSFDSILLTLNLKTFERRSLFPSISPKTRAVSAPDSPNMLAIKNSTKSIPSVSM